MSGALARSLPEFRLEVHFERWEFEARHHLTASDAETLSIAELLALAGDGALDGLTGLRLGYTTTRGDEALRTAIAATYDTLDPDDVLVCAGAEEALFWALQVMLGPGEHAVVTVPNYQSMESVPLATGAEVTGLPLWTGTGSDLHWTLDLDRLVDALRPTTRVVAVNVPNNPTGLVPDREVWRDLVALCDQRGIRLFSDEVYRGLETDPARTVTQAADASPGGVSLNVMSKAYGLPGLRIGWLAARDRGFLQAVERAKHYTSICAAGPSEYLATLALRHGDAIRERNRGILAANLALVDDFMAGRDEFEWRRPDGGCVAFPRYLGADGVEEFCRAAVAEAGVLLLPSSIYASELTTVPPDRFRLGLGRRGVGDGLAALSGFLSSHSG